MSLKEKYKNLKIPNRSPQKVLIKPNWCQYYHEYILSHWIKKSWYCYAIDLKNQRLGNLSLTQVWLNGSGTDNEIRFYINYIDLGFPFGKPLFSSSENWGPIYSINKYPGRGIYPGSKEEYENLLIQIDNFINNNLRDLIS